MTVYKPVLLRSTIENVAEIEKTDIAARRKSLTGGHSKASSFYSGDNLDRPRCIQAGIMRMALSRCDSFCRESPILPGPLLDSLGSGHRASDPHVRL
jgi:hypothetical protein